MLEDKNDVDKDVRNANCIIAYVIYWRKEKILQHTHTSACLYISFISGIYFTTQNLNAGNIKVMSTNFYLGFSDFIAVLIKNKKQKLNIRYSDTQ